MAGKSKPESKANFSSVLQADVPHVRNGKHQQIVSKVLSDMSNLEPGRALKIRLAELPDTKENVRSALNRVGRQRGMKIATSSDAAYLYIWDSSNPANGKT